VVISGDLAFDILGVIRLMRGILISLFLGMFFGGIFPALLFSQKSPNPQHNN
jgi:hypothetical protein